jgi:hypothetical protein
VPSALGGLDQFAVGHAARTGRLATATLHARVEGVPDVVVEIESIDVQGPHDLDPTTR